MIAVEKMTIRVPREFKRKVRSLARKRMLSDSDIIREAVIALFAANKPPFSSPTPAIATNGEPAS